MWFGSGEGRNVRGGNKTVPSSCTITSYVRLIDPAKPWIDKIPLLFPLSIAPSVAHEESDVPVVMRGNDAYQMVKISRTGRDGVDMDQCPAYGVVGNK